LLFALCFHSMNIGQLYRIVPKTPAATGPTISSSASTGASPGKRIEITVVPSSGTANKSRSNIVPLNTHNASKSAIPTGQQPNKVVHLTPASTTTSTQIQHQRNKQPSVIIEETTSDVYSDEQYSTSSSSSVVRNKNSKRPGKSDTNNNTQTPMRSNNNNKTTANADTEVVEHYTFSDLSSHIIDRTIGNITGKRQGKKRRDEPPSISGCFVDILDEKCMHIMSSLLVTEVVQKFQHYVQQSEKALLDSWNNTTTNHRDNMISNNEQAIPASHRVIVDGSALR